MKKIILFIAVIMLLVGMALNTKSNVLLKNKHDSLKAWENDTAAFAKQALDMGFAATDGTIIVVPITFKTEEIDGKPITAINTCTFFRCQNLESVTIPDTINSVAENAFFACPRLKSITSSTDFFGAVGGVNSPIFMRCNITRWNYSDTGIGPNSPLYPKFMHFDLFPENKIDYK